MFVKKLVGRTDMENALKRLENMTLEESRMTGAEALKAIHDVKRMIQDMLQSVDDRIKDVGDNVINSASIVHFPRPVLSLSMRLGVEGIGRQTAVTLEGLEAVCDKAGVDGARSTIKNIRSRDTASDGAQFFPNQALASGLS
jgi:hypothetical protein